MSSQARGHDAGPVAAAPAGKSKTSASTTNGNLREAANRTDDKKGVERSIVDPLTWPEEVAAETEGQDQATLESEAEATEREKKRAARQISSSNIDALLATGRQQDSNQSSDPIQRLKGGTARNMGDSTTTTGRGGSRRDADSVDASPTRRPEVDTESSADEETNILRRAQRGGGVNYQGTATSPTRAQQQQGKDKNGSGTKKNKGGRGDGGNRSQTAEVSEEEAAEEHEGWWSKFISKYGSVELENKGSVARDHLALERTFLAWLRTSLAFASIGIAITQLFRLNLASSSPSSPNSPDRFAHLRAMGKPLGATFLAISIVMLGIGFHRYFESQHWIIRGKFPASRGSIVLVALITGALMVTSLVVVVVVEPGAREK